MIFDVFFLKNNFKLKMFRISRGRKTLLLTRLEYSLLRNLCLKKSINSKFILDKIINRNDCMYDTKIKIKNKLISNLNYKFSEKFNENLIKSQPSKNDLREISYTLNENIKIHT